MRAADRRLRDHRNDAIPPAAGHGAHSQEAMEEFRVLAGRRCVASRAAGIIAAGGAPRRWPQRAGVLALSAAAALCGCCGALSGRRRAVEWCARRPGGRAPSPRRDPDRKSVQLRASQLDSLPCRRSRSTPCRRGGDLDAAASSLRADAREDRGHAADARSLQLGARSMATPHRSFRYAVLERTIGTLHSRCLHGPQAHVAEPTRFSIAREGPLARNRIGQGPRMLSACFRRILRFRRDAWIRAALLLRRVAAPLR